MRLFDTVEVSPLSPVDSRGDSAAPIRIDRVWGPTSRGTPTDGRNLVCRALRLLQQESATAFGAAIRLHKRIPSQAGLGGGSSDAAAGLIAANRSWQLGWSLGDLTRLAAQIGSDLPFFVEAIAARLDPRRRRGCAGFCTGRGETVRNFRSLSGKSCVIVKPTYGLSTPDVYKSKAAKGYDKASPDDVDWGGDSAAIEDALEGGSWLGVGDGVGNALQAAAMAVEPRLRDLANLFEKLPVFAHRLSGSGSAYYGLCQTRTLAERVAGTLRARRVGDVILAATC